MDSVHLDVFRHQVREELGAIQFGRQEQVEGRVQVYGSHQADPRICQATS